VSFVPFTSFRTRLIGAMPGVTLGSGVSIGFGTVIGVDVFEAEPESTIGRCNRISGPIDVHIGPRCYIGSSVRFAFGTGLGAVKVVSLGSVVTKDMRSSARSASVPRSGRRAHSVCGIGVHLGTPRWPSHSPEHRRPGTSIRQYHAEIRTQCSYRSHAAQPGCLFRDVDARQEHPHRRGGRRILELIRGIERHAERTVPYQAVQEHLETWLARQREADPQRDPIPAYGERDLRRHLECGILAYG